MQRPTMQSSSGKGRRRKLPEEGAARGGGGGGGGEQGSEEHSMEDKTGARLQCTGQWRRETDLGHRCWASAFP